MQILTTEHIRQLPLLIISFGGGMGGFSYHYRAVEVEQELPILIATGFPLPPDWLNNGLNFFVRHREELVMFQMIGTSRHERDEVRQLLSQDKWQEATRLATGPQGPMYRSIRREIIHSSGHWNLIFPAK